MLACGSAVMKLLTLETVSNKVMAMELAKYLRYLEESLMMNKSVVVMLLVLWTVLLLLSVGVVVVYNNRGWRVTTTTRKLFHLAIVGVYVSGGHDNP